MDELHIAVTFESKAHKLKTFLTIIATKMAKILMSFGMDSHID